MTHVEKITEMRLKLIEDIKSFMSDNKLELIKFNQSFYCIEFDEDAGIIENVAKYLNNDGEMTGTDLTGDYVTWDLSSMDIVELAHTLDTLEAMAYTIEDEIFTDENDQIGNDSKVIDEEL